MQYQDARSAATEPQMGEAYENQAEAVAENEVVRLRDATNLAAIELHANQLLNYIRNLMSSTDRPRAPILHQSLSAQPVEDAYQSEVGVLRSPAQESFASVERYRRELDSRENIFKGQRTVLMGQLNDREAEIKHLRLEVEESNRQAESLHTELTQKDENIQLKSSALQKAEIECRATKLECEQRLRDREVDLHGLEAQLKEKVAVIQETAGKEAGIGNLIKQLSTECQNLNIELREKNRLLNEAHSKKPQLAREDYVWHRVILNGSVDGR